MRVASITRDDVKRFAATLFDRPVERNRVLAFVSRIFTLTEHWGWRGQHTNPVRGVERGVETARKRVLSPDEIVVLSGALEAGAFEVACLGGGDPGRGAHGVADLRGSRDAVG